MTKKEIIKKFRQDKSWYITVGELKKRLNDYPDDMPIILSKDEEGNSFSPLCENGMYIYVPETTFHGEEVHGSVIHGLEEDECIEVVVLWPLN